MESVRVVICETFCRLLVPIAQHIDRTITSSLVRESTKLRRDKVNGRRCPCVWVRFTRRPIDEDLHAACTSPKAAELALAQSNLHDCPSRGVSVDVGSSMTDEWRKVGSEDRKLSLVCER